MTIKRILSIGLVVSPFFACSSTPTSQSNPATNDGGESNLPADQSDAGIGEPEVDSGELEGDNCACPTHCPSKSNPSMMVCNPAPAPAKLPASQAIGKFKITGYEYWQWKKADPYDGGNEVAWGYNGDGQPDTGVKPTDASRACMAEARKVLETILKTDVPPELEALRAAKGVTNFWNWNNDMTDAPASRKVPKQYDGLWLFDGARGDGGLIKWISATERDGTCRLPSREDLVTFAKACVTAFPDCGSGK